MDATRPLVRTGTLLVAVALVALAGCTTNGTTPRTSAPGTAARPLSTGLLPVWHRTESAFGALGPDDSDSLVSWTSRERVGFVDTSGQVVAEPVYLRYRLCPGREGTAFVVAQASDRVDVLDAEGTVIGSASAELRGCGRLAGYAELYRVTGDEWESWTATLPDLSPSDLPVGGVAVDDDWVLVTSYSEDDDTTTTELVDRSGHHVPAAGDTGWGYFSYADEGVLSTGEWPVPAADDEGQQGYLDRTGRWVAPPRFSTALPFVHGHAAVSDGTLSHFVDPSLDQTGPDYGDVYPVVVMTGSPFAHVLAYTVTPPGRTSQERSGLLAPDLTVLADPATSRTDCHQSYDWLAAACLVVDDTGPRLVALPEGTSTPLPDGFTAVLSTHLVATADGTRVYSTATGAAFDVPAPFHVPDWWWSPGGDAFVVCESDNGLRLVLDATGAVTPFAGVEYTVTTTDGTVYYWVTAGDQQGYVDATGTWLYRESRHQTTED